MFEIFFLYLPDGPQTLVPGVFGGSEYKFFTQIDPIEILEVDIKQIIFKKGVIY